MEHLYLCIRNMAFIIHQKTYHLFFQGFLFSYQCRAILNNTHEIILINRQRRHCIKRLKTEADKNTRGEMAQGGAFSTEYGPAAEKVVAGCSNFLRLRDCNGIRTQKTGSPVFCVLLQWKARPGGLNEVLSFGTHEIGRAHV